MRQATEKQVQVLRTMDKVDKIGIDGVVGLLQSPQAEFGADLDPVQANLVGLFLETGTPDNESTLKNMEAFFPRAAQIRTRFDVMVALDAQTISDAGTTAWDSLLDMPKNADQTWNNGGRPENIAWALDDLALAARAKREAAK